MKDLFVLLVEDNEADIELTTQLLSQVQLDNNLHVVRDGEEAIDFISKMNNDNTMPTPDLVILDINLPKIDGKEVLKFIKEDERFKSIRVIMYTSSSWETDIKYCKEMNANLYLTKANSALEYFNTIEELKKFTATNFAI